MYAVTRTRGRAEQRVQTVGVDPGLHPNIGDGALLRCGNGRKQLWNEGLKIRETIGMRSQNDDCDCEGRKILLKGKISIDSNEYIKLLGG